MGTTATYAPNDESLLAAIDHRLAATFAALDAKDYREETKAILRAIAEVGADRGGEPFSANDVRPYLPAEIENTHRIGRAFLLACDLGWIEFVGRVRSTDKGTHGKRINVWRWVS